MTAGTGKGRRSAADADAAGVTLSTARGKPDDPARIWADRIANLPPEGAARAAEPPGPAADIQTAADMSTPAATGQGTRNVADTARIAPGMARTRPDDPARVWTDRIANLPEEGAERTPEPAQPAPAADADTVAETIAPAAGTPPVAAPRKAAARPLNLEQRWFIALVVMAILLVSNVSRLMSSQTSPAQPISDQTGKPAGSSPPPVAAEPAKPANAPGTVILDNGNASMRYDTIPYDWSPDLAALTVNNPGDFYGSVDAPKTGFLAEFSIVHFDRLSDLGSIDGLPDRDRDQLQKDYAAIVAQHAAVLTCGYAVGDGRNHTYKYWYRFRPPQAEPDYAREVSPHNPLLKIASPQNTCPPNRLQGQWASDVPVPEPYDFSRDDPGSASWDPHKGVWH